MTSPILKPASLIGPRPLQLLHVTQRIGYFFRTLPCPLPRSLSLSPSQELEALPALLAELGLEPERLVVTLAVQVAGLLRVERLVALAADVAPGRTAGRKGGKKR